MENHARDEHGTLPWLGTQPSTEMKRPTNAGECVGDANLNPSDELIEAVTARLNQARSGEATRGSPFSAGFVRSMSLLLASDDYAAAERVLLRLSRGDRSFIEIAEGLLGEVARDLGRSWDEDRLSFSEVSLGISCILRLRLRLSSLLVDGNADPRKKALFATLPNQSHTLGLLLTADAFRDASWSTDICVADRTDMIVRRAKEWRPSMMCMTMGRASRLKDVLSVAEGIKQLPFRCFVMVGGNAAQGVSGSLRSLPIDAIASDMACAISTAEDVVADSIGP